MPPCFYLVPFISISIHSLIPLEVTIQWLESVRLFRPVIPPDKYQKEVPVETEESFHDKFIRILGAANEKEYLKGYNGKAQPAKDEQAKAAVNYKQWFNKRKGYA